MKKIILIALFTITSLFANDVMKESMLKMETGLNDIQKGYLYNSLDLIKRGLAEVQSGNELFQKADMANYLPENKKNMLKRSQEYSFDIAKTTTVMSNKLSQRKIIDALEQKVEIIKACTACHGIVRNW